MQPQKFFAHSPYPRKASHSRTRLLSELSFDHRFSFPFRWRFWLARGSRPKWSFRSLAVPLVLIDPIGHRFTCPIFQQKLANQLFAPIAVLCQRVARAGKEHGTQD